MAGAKSAVVLVPLRADNLTGSMLFVAHCCSHLIIASR